MPKYLWIGVTLSDFEREKIVKSGGKILSANVSQNNILDGICQNGILLDSINAYRLGTYPAYKEKKIIGDKWSRNGGNDISVSYWNYRYVNHLLKTNALKKEARKWAKQHKYDDVTVFVYSMHSPFMSAAKEVKKMIPNAQIVQIVPDLPQYMDLAMSKTKMFLKKIDWIKIKGLMKSVDKYILYSRHMAEFLGLKDDSWTVMEGSIKKEDMVEVEAEKGSNVISVMYSGVCDLRYGIPELLDAFDLIKDENYELWITGAGNAVSLIKERAEKDKRIKFYGFLPSREDLLKKQRQATMMINTRKPTEQASRYCFPSKLFEYMLTGNPVLSFDIPGIPDEYFNYLIKMEEVSPECIKESILKVASMEETTRYDLGEKTKSFILENKNNVVQAKKILDFVNKN